MSMHAQKIDARGLACPQPVIQTRNALKAGGFSHLEVLVDNDAALANVKRFAEHSGHEVSFSRKDNGEFTITIEAKGEAPEDAGQREEEAYRLATANCVRPETAAVTLPYPRGAAGKTLFIASDSLGQGERELGRLLMGAFFYALTEMEEKPKRIVLMNSGVKVAVTGAKELEDLRKLQEAGVELVACGTCLDYYGLKESLEVGIISNMYDIAGFLLEGDTLTI